MTKAEYADLVQRFWWAENFYMVTLLHGGTHLRRMAFVVGLQGKERIRSRYLWVEVDACLDPLAAMARATFHLITERLAGEMQAERRLEALLGSTSAEEFQARATDITTLTEGTGLFKSIALTQAVASERLLYVLPLLPSFFTEANRRTQATFYGFANHFARQALPTHLVIVAEADDALEVVSALMTNNVGASIMPVRLPSA